MGVSNETLIILLLLLDVREQLLIRKIKSFSNSQNRTVAKMSDNDFFLIKDKFFGHSGPIFVFFLYQQPKRKFFKNENHFAYVCQ